MVLEHGLHRRTDRHVLTRVAKQIAHHAGAIVVRELHQRDDVRSLFVQRRMHRMPNALVAVDARRLRHLLEGQIIAVALMANPLGAPLPSATATATLHHQATFRCRLPIGRIEAVRRGYRFRQAGIQIGFVLGSAHNVASEPKMLELTGVTIGPDTTIETSTSCTGFGDVPRICRTASMFNSKPCM